MPLHISSLVLSISVGAAFTDDWGHMSISGRQAGRLSLNVGKNYSKCDELGENLNFDGKCMSLYTLRDWSHKGS